MQTQKTTLLFLGCTHGNEKVGEQIYKDYLEGENQYFKWTTQIGNPLALEQNVRYIEQDLNRSFPGKNDGKYEEKRAFELTESFKKNDMIIDFHQTFADMESCIIASNISGLSLKLMTCFDISRIVILSNSFDKGKNTVADWCTGFGIEYPRNSDTAKDYEIAKNDIENLLNQTRTYKDKTVYEMQTRVDKATKVRYNLDWRNWKQLERKDVEELDLDLTKDYYPIFIGEVAYSDTYAILVSKKGLLNMDFPELIKKFG